jgi:hypothetical protein
MAFYRIIAIKPAVIASENTVRLTHPTVLDLLEGFYCNCNFTGGDSLREQSEAGTTFGDTPFFLINSSIVASGITVWQAQSKVIGLLEGSYCSETIRDSILENTDAGTTSGDRSLRRFSRLNQQ